MIKTEVHANELFGENLAKGIRKKINKMIYWIVGVGIVGGLSSLYLFSRGFVRGWTKTRFPSGN